MVSNMQTFIGIILVSVSIIVEAFSISVVANKDSKIAKNLMYVFLFIALVGAVLASPPTSVGR